MDKIDKDVIMSVRIPVLVKTKLRIECIKKGISVRKFLTDIIKEYFEREK